MKSLYPKLSLLSLALLIPAGVTMNNLHANVAVVQTQPMLGIDAARMEVVKAAIGIIKSNKPGAPGLTTALFDTVQKKRIKPITDEDIVETAESKAAAIAQLQSDICHLNETETFQFTLELKEDFIKNLTLDHKIHIFIHLSEHFLSADPQPFKTHVLSNVTQFHIFIFIIKTLLENESQFKNLVVCFQKCLDAKQFWQVMGKLQDVNTKVLPPQIGLFLDKNLFDPKQANSIKRRVMHLMSH